MPRRRLGGVTSTTRSRPTAGNDVERRRLRAGALIIGGVLTALLLDPIGPLDFYWLPLFTGASYLAAAVVSGRRGPLWAPGVIVSIFGLEAALTLSGRITGVPDAPGEVLACGIGVLVVAVLARAGFAVDLLGAGFAVALIGAFYLALSKDWVSGIFVKPWLYGIILVVWGAWELRPAGTPSRR